MVTFPKNIFQVWFQGCHTVDNPLFIQNMTNWKTLNKEWTYRCVSDTDLQNVCKQFSDECYFTYLKFEDMHSKIDFGRYVLLYIYGGLYVDMDAYILRSLQLSTPINQLINKFNSKTHVMGFSSLNTSALESMVYVQRSTMLNNAILLSSPKNPILKTFIEFIIEKAKTNKRLSQQFERVTQTTGPLMFNRFFWEVIDNLSSSEHILEVFPSTVFEPCFGNTCALSNNTISIHTMEATWVPSWLIALRDMYFKLKDNSMYIIIALILYNIYTRNFSPNVRSRK
jgi:mannosyltransferase OCH1-like enzyme